jgi:hypothetical protein
MGFELVSQIAGQGVEFDTSQLMSNGKVLLLKYSSGICYIFEPDEYGSYRNGRVRRTMDIPQTALYGPITVANNGNVVVHVGEYGTSTLGWTSVFNPETERWYEYPAKVSAHSLALLASDGTVFGDKRLAPNALPTAAETYVQNNPLGLPTPVMGQYKGFAECSAVMMPGGQVAVIESIAGNYDTQVPYYGQLTFNSPSAGEISYQRTDCSTLLGTVNNTWWRLPNSNARRRWCSVGEPINGIDYEPGVLTYMAKIQKLVLVSGVGALFTMPVTASGADPSSLARPATMPNTPLWASTNTGSVVDGQLSLITHLGVVHSASAGKTGAQVATDGTLTLQCVTAADANLAQQQASFATHLFVRLASNTKWVKFAYTSATWAGGSATTVVLNGVSLPSWPGASWDGTTLAVGDQACLGRPSYDNRDGAATFLPNGDLIFTGGAVTTAFEAFNGGFRVLKWDGSTATAVETAADSTSAFPLSEFIGCMFPLPDGTIWFGYGPYSKVYVPTTAESVPLSNSLPVITTAPTSIAAGGRFSLLGAGLSGVHEGGYFSEDRSPRTNFPIVRLTNNVSGLVHWCMTRDFTYRGINPGQPSSCNVIVPYTVPAGTYTMNVIVNGVASANRTITVDNQSGGEPMFLNWK